MTSPDGVGYEFSLVHGRVVFSRAPAISVGENPFTFTIQHDIMLKVC
jgi:hypothetical protein